MTWTFAAQRVTTAEMAQQAPLTQFEGCEEEIEPGHKWSGYSRCEEYLLRWLPNRQYHMWASRGRGDFYFHRGRFDVVIFDGIHPHPVQPPGLSVRLLEAG